MKKIILACAMTLIFAAILATPVLAIGPFQAYEVGNNKNLRPLGSALGNFRGGEGKGSIYWMWMATDQHWVRWEYQDALQAKGLINVAIIAQYSGSPSGMSAYFVTLSSDENDNKWIYLSGDGGANPSQYMGHGMLYWFAFGIARLGGANSTAAAGIASGIVSRYPAGEFWRHNTISA